MATKTIRKKTKICALNLEEELISYLSERFDVYKGSLGDNIDVAKINENGLRLLATIDVPNNIQEYEVFIENMHHDDSIPYVKGNHIHSINTGSSEYYIISRPPQTVANLYCIGSYIFKGKLREGRNRPAIKIAFQSRRVEVEYYTKNVYDPYSGRNHKHFNCEHLNYFYGNEIEGCEVRLADNRISKVLFESLLDDIKYYRTFDVPAIWEDKKRVVDSHFVSLLESVQGAVVSYAWVDDDDITIILPQTSHKKELLDKVFNELLFRCFSDYFPEVDECSWIENDLYRLPGYGELMQRKETLTTKYEADINEVEKDIEKNNKRYGFLHTLLTGTGDELVQAMIKYLKWLGFSNVIDKDTTKEEGAPLEEDIQVDLESEGLLVIEVKGIGGTSTDAQCSQIHKIVHRREKERKSFDVHGIYIVNNEMHKEPLQRTMPPFTTEQIKDAQYDERGLAYTWQFFNLYFDIELGVISKEEARARLLGNGLINFSPNLVEVGMPYKYHQQHMVVCVAVGDVSINKGDCFYYCENGRWNKVNITSIQLDGKEVDSAINGNFGFGLAERVPNNVCLFMK